jgi:putative ABC transport system substrate-binding protein
VTSGPAATSAARHATDSIPVVSVGPDPVAIGLASSFARPGGNVTGVRLEAGSAMNGKRLELLKQLVPTAHRVAVIRGRPQTPVWDATTEAAARALGLSLEIAAADLPEDLDAMFAEVTRDGPDAILCIDSPLTLSNRQRIVDFAARRRLPTIYAVRAFAESGGLMSYGGNLDDLSRRAAGYVDKILKGTKPAELPVEQGNKFELVINLRAAKALGLTIPQALLLRADEVIQ